MKTAKTVLASSIFLGMAFGTAHAETCYNLAPFIDVVRVIQTTSEDEATEGSHTAVVGNWTAGNLYSLPVTGSLDVNVPRTAPSTRRLGLHGTQHTTFFANHSDCTLDGTPNGPWTVSCAGRVAGIFNNSGAMLAVISCDTVSTSSVAASGRAAGE
jgi:hypothetical protein